MKILFLSHTYWDSLYRVGSHHLATQLAASGHSVLYISTPISPVHYLKFPALKARIRCAGKLQNALPNLHTYVPFTPVPCGLVVRSGFDVAFPTGGALRRVCAQLGIDKFDLVLVDDPKLLGILRHVRYDKLVYRPTDIYSQMGLKNWRALEAHLLRHCDAVVATSGPVLSFLNETFAAKKPGMVLVNGVDFELFAQPQPRPAEYTSERKRCVYVGILDFRFDFDALYALASARSQVDFYIIGLGEAQQIERFKTLPNVFFLGSRPYTSVPAYLQHADVGLLPLRPIAANMGRSPMKLYEYLAAGVPVLALQTDELRRRNTRRVFCYSDSDDLVAAFDAALQEPRESYFEPELAWSRISQNMLSFIG